MTKKGRLILITIALAVTFDITACASSSGETRKGGTRGNLKD
jgi:hypothetical protein